MQRRSSDIDNVPPWCFMAPGRRPEDAARRAARALGLTKPVDLIVLLWKLRAMADGGGE